MNGTANFIVFLCAHEIHLRIINQARESERYFQLIYFHPANAFRARERLRLRQFLFRYPPCAAPSPRPSPSRQMTQKVLFWEEEHKANRFGINHSTFAKRLLEEGNRFSTNDKIETKRWWKSISFFSHRYNDWRLLAWFARESVFWYESDCWKFSVVIVDFFIFTPLYVSLYFEINWWMSLPCNDYLKIITQSSF